jgi:hypothetical protein
MWVLAKGSFPAIQLNLSQQPLMAFGIVPVAALRNPNVVGKT